MRCDLFPSFSTHLLPYAPPASPTQSQTSLPTAHQLSRSPTQKKDLLIVTALPTKLLATVADPPLKNPFNPNSLTAHFSALTSALGTHLPSTHFASPLAGGKTNRFKNE